MTFAIFRDGRQISKAFPAFSIAAEEAIARGYETGIGSSVWIAAVAERELPAAGCEIREVK